MTLAEAFYRIFAGLEHAHGRYVVAPGTKPDERGKVAGQANTRDRPVTIKDWEGHLSGGDQIGIVPIRMDASCVFGAIDVDIYPLDHQELANAIMAAGLPLVVCRTKSGGAHLYCFTHEPVPAALMRKKLLQWAQYLGYAQITDKKTGKKRSVEIFPKQDKLENAEDNGSWINIPYYGGARSLRYAVGKRVLSVEEFVQCVVAKAVADEAELEMIDPVAVQPPQLNPNNGAQTVAKLPDNAMAGAPPCLLTLARIGFDAGSRNNAMFNLAVFAKKSYPPGWKDMVREFNRTLMNPPLSEEEIQNTIKSVERKTYTYKCKDTPIVDHCDRKVCLTCEFGVGGGVMIGESGLEFGRMTKVTTKPVLWLWHINNEILELETGDLMNQRKFQARVLEGLNFWPPVVKPHEWRKHVQEATQKAELMSVPDDATLAGQLLEQLGNFCTGRVAGRSLDELLLKKPFTAEGRSYFVIADFISWLIQHRFPTRIDERAAFLILREHDLQHHRSNLKGKEVGYWSVPEFQKQTQEHDVPRQQAEEPM